MKIDFEDIKTWVQILTLAFDSCFKFEWVTFPPWAIS